MLVCFLIELLEVNLGDQLDVRRPGKDIAWRRENSYCKIENIDEGMAKKSRRPIFGGLIENNQKGHRLFFSAPSSLFSILRQNILKLMANAAAGRQGAADEILLEILCGTDHKVKAMS